MKLPEISSRSTRTTPAATAVSAAINASPTLASAGITATADENRVATNGHLTHQAISDTGLSNSEPIPALPGPLATTLVAIALASIGIRAQRAKSKSVVRDPDGEGKERAI